MIIRPVYNILLLPDVTYYFKADFFSDFCRRTAGSGNRHHFRLREGGYRGLASLQAGDLLPHRALCEEWKISARMMPYRCARCTVSSLTGLTIDSGPG